MPKRCAALGGLVMVARVLQIRVEPEQARQHEAGEDEQDEEHRPGDREAVPAQAPQRVGGRAAAPRGERGREGGGGGGRGAHDSLRTRGSIQA